MEWVSKRDYHEECIWWQRDEEEIQALEYNQNYTYKVGDVVSYQEILYQCKVNINMPEAFSPNKWIKVADTGEDDELIMQRQPSGYFMAKEISAETYDSGIIGGAFRHDRSTVTIRTPENVIGLKNDCLVKYQDDVWRVVSVQRRNIRNGMTEFAIEDEVPHFFYIQLRR